MSLTPLESQMLQAIVLAQQTAYPFQPPPVGLGLDPLDAANTSPAAYQRRTMAVEKACREAVEAARVADEDAAEVPYHSNWVDVENARWPLPTEPPNVTLDGHFTQADLRRIMKEFAL